MFKNKFVFRSLTFVLALMFLSELVSPVQAVCSDALGCVTLASTDPIHIAYLLDLTGGGSGIGLEEQRGAQIAIDDSGGKILGHDILFDGQDGTCSSAGGSAAAQILDDDPTIVAVIGTTCSSEAISAMSYLSAAGFSVVSPSNTNSTLTEPGNPNHYDGYLRVSWNDNLQGGTAAQYVFDVLGLTTAATLDDGGPYSAGIAQAFADEFIGLGGTITSQQVIEPGNSADIDAKLAIIAADTPALLYMPVFASEGGYILDHLPAGLADAQLMGADGLWDPSLNTATGEDGLLLTNYDFTATHNSDFVTQFLPAYRTKYGSDPVNPFHAHAYDAFMMIKAAIESVAVETAPGEHQIGRQALRDALYATLDFDGLTGNLACDTNGDCADTYMSVYQFHTDQFPPQYLTPEKVGLVMEVSGLGDKSFNYTSYQGLQQAQTVFGIAKTLYWPSSSDDYETSLQQCADEGNALCFSVGFGMQSAVTNTANLNPNTKFAGIDINVDPAPANLRGLVFDEKQVGYLAGTLAGKMSSTNTVGVVGGMAVPPVVAFAEGYRNGAQCAASANVLINYTGTFTDPDLGATVAADMINDGADVVFGAAGLTGNGAILYSAQHGVWSIGVDADQYISVFDDGGIPGSDKLLTSAMKKLDVAVYDTIEDYLSNSFTSGTLLYDLAVDGVGLAPYHEADASIPQAVKDYVTAVQQGILDQTIDVDTTCQPITLSIGAQDGWILESSEFSGMGGTLNKTATTLRVGDDAANKQYRAILSFDTPALPEGVIVTSITLQFKHAGVSGTNPFTTHGKLLADICKGSFKNDPALQLGDFKPLCGKNKVLIYSNTKVNNWYSQSLLPDDFQYVNLGGVTQFRLRFSKDDNNDFGADFLKLYSGNAGAANRPQLVIEYYVQ